MGCWAGGPVVFSSKPCSLKSGTKVRLDGLVGAAHLNGATGVLHHFNHQTQRWHVELLNGETKAVRPENVEVLGAQQRTASGGAFFKGAQRLLFAIAQWPPVKWMMKCSTK